MCYMKRVHGASARFWSEAFRFEPKLADDMNVQNRYNAACAAALAGSGQGKDDPPLDDAKKAHWRKQAIDWLKADLAARSKILATGPPQAKQLVTQTLQHWKADTDLAGLRDADAMAKLSSRRAESLPGTLGRGGRSAGEGPEHQYRARPLRNGPAGLPHATTNRGSARVSDPAGMPDRRSPARADRARGFGDLSVKPVARSGDLATAQSCRALWAEADALLARAQGTSAGPGH